LPPENPSPQFGAQDGSPPAEEPMWAANALKSLVTSLLPHSVQAIVVSDRTSFSKVLPQPLHLYSKMGTAVPPCHAA
jgi:hypothetical protein